MQLIMIMIESDISGTGGAFQRKATREKCDYSAFGYLHI